MGLVEANLQLCSPRTSKTKFPTAYWGDWELWSQSWSQETLSQRQVPKKLSRRDKWMPPMRGDQGIKSGVW